jgi:hypothetical protein
MWREFVPTQTVNEQEMVRVADLRNQVGSRFNLSKLVTGLGIRPVIINRKAYVKPADALRIEEKIREHLLANPIRAQPNLMAKPKRQQDNRPPKELVQDALRIEEKIREHLLANPIRAQPNLMAKPKRQQDNRPPKELVQQAEALCEYFTPQEIRLKLDLSWQMATRIADFIAENSS